MATWTIATTTTNPELAAKIIALLTSEGIAPSIDVEGLEPNGDFKVEITRKRFRAGMPRPEFAWSVTGPQGEHNYGICWTEQEARDAADRTIRAIRSGEFAAQKAAFAARKRAAAKAEAATVEPAVAEPATNTPRATPNQIDRITSLLIRRYRSGDEGGFFATGGLMADGHVDRAAVAALSRQKASELISSLTGNY